MSIEPNLLAALISGVFTLMIAIGGGILNYLRSIAKSMKDLEISVAKLAVRIEFIEDNGPTKNGLDHAAPTAN